jgi:hypothetical protein
MQGSLVIEKQCANCGALLTGPYCAACGQHAHESARGISVLLHDAWHLMTHVDGRFWRTMQMLLLRPGYLTQEYFAERRARYLPPVRLYLVLSVLFFTFAFVGSGTVLLSPHADAARSAPDTKASFFGTQDCQTIHSSLPWFENLMRRSCERNFALNGEPVRAAFVSYIPKMMFVFLPAIAAVMLLLYWRPRRYYVEHLVFFLHTHAAMFLLMLLYWPLSKLASRLPSPNFAEALTAGTVLYAIWYVYSAMRRYYGQRRWTTVAKLSVVGCAYLIFLAATLFATLVFSALFA